MPLKAIGAGTLAGAAVSLICAGRLGHDRAHRVT